MKKLLVWGIGNYTKQFINNGYDGDIIGFIETKKSCDYFMGKPVYSCVEIPDHYDFIIVANSFAREIYKRCLDLKLDLSKIIFLYGFKDRIGCSEQKVLKQILLEKNYTRYCNEFNLVDGTFIERDIAKYNELNNRPSFAIQDQYMWPILYDRFCYAGAMGNYFLQDLWAAKLIVKEGIKKHFDIGSRLDGFIAHLLAAGIDVTMIDVREFPSEMEGLHTIVDDATSLHQVSDESIESLSALCSIEHFGLGRYGDSINPEACFECFDNIQKKLKRGGKLYISLPVGKERVEFNAHRVFYAETIISCFSSLKLEEFSCAADGKIEYNVDIHKYDADNHHGDYRYGLFQFVKE